MKRFLPVLILFLSVSFASAAKRDTTLNTPTRRSASGIDYTINQSSWIPFNNATVSSTRPVTVSTTPGGNFGIYGVFVSSPGVNSKVLFFNHGSTMTLPGVGSEFAQFNTNTYGWIPMNVEVSTGGTNDGLAILITSQTASGLAGTPFLAPSLFIPLERKR